ncbi:MAG: sigma 54-interacting transcriptional regulator [Marinilabiliaceae bacterium]|nr:sigma 54-interacting transcriptional regulator [Marinilabiliaceae bacterium]
MVSSGQYTNTEESENLDDIHILSEVIAESASNLKDTAFTMVVVNHRDVVVQLLKSSHCPADFEKKIRKGHRWTTIINNLDWQEVTKTQGSLKLYETDFHWASHPLHHPVGSPYSLYLIAPHTVPQELHTLILSAIDDAIQSRIKDASMQKKMDDTHQFTFAIMNALKVGVIAINPKGKILFANDHACRSINIRRRELLKIPIKKLIPYWNNIYQMVASGEKFINEEIVITGNNTKTKYNVNVSPIRDQEQTKLIGMVIAIRELENVYNLVNKYTGMQARYTFSDIIAKSRIMRKLVDYSGTIANSPSTVLIEGESGTGKEVFAQSIHNASSRHENGFVAINCAAIPENLIESELFGYDDGAFTGAKKGGHPGKFELANGGTLFLDEIGDMKLEMQVKLLRAIQEGAITRIGGNKTIPVDVRLIAATNKNLKNEVDKGQFRLDLYYRLSVIPIKIPALRDRKEDLPSLIRFFLNKKSLKLQKKVPQLRYSTLQEFLDYNWPGNIRELENAIEQIVNLDGIASFEDLKMEFNREPESDLVKPITETSVTKEIPLVTFQEMEKKMIQKAIAFHNSNMTKVAETLGISRNTLYLKIKKYGFNTSAHD